MIPCWPRLTPGTLECFPLICLGRFDSHLLRNGAGDFPSYINSSVIEVDVLYLGGGLAMRRPSNGLATA